MNQYEMAYRVWPCLCKIAEKKKTVTYGDLGAAIGIHHRPIRKALGCIQDFCLEQRLPPLTILVVSKQSRQPSGGFIAWDVDHLEAGYDLVYDYNWKSLDNPFQFASDGSDLAEIVKKLLNKPDESGEQFAKIKVRGVAQRIFRQALLQAYDYRCAISGISFIECLDAAHIVPWAESSADMRMHVQNGILMSSVHHRLFDLGYLTIDEKYRIVWEDVSMEKYRPYSQFDKALTVGLHGKKISLPALEKHWPSIDWIRTRNASDA